jgi:serine/threonine protein phosphatase 1
METREPNRMDDTARGAPLGFSWLRRPRRPLEGKTSGELIYAIGDVHGRLDLLTDLVARVQADAGDRPHTLILCGDYVDRGPHSAEVIDYLLELRERPGGRVRFLKGNHEQAFLFFIDDPGSGVAWLEHFGGAATLQSYGVTPPPARAPKAELVAARDELMANMPASHLRLLQRLELMIVLGDYAFVHAGVAPNLPLASQTEGELLWARGEFLDAPGPFEKIIVHGHTWIDEQPVLLDHRIGIDTGAYETGALTAVRLQDGRRDIIQALDEGALRRAEDRAAQALMLVKRPANYVAAAAEEIRALFGIPVARRSREAEPPSVEQPP